MRFMVMVKATKDSEAGVMPDTRLLTEMGKYNEEPTAASGLYPLAISSSLRSSAAAHPGR